MGCYGGGKQGKNEKRTGEIATTREVLREIRAMIPEPEHHSDRRDFFDAENFGKKEERGGPEREWGGGEGMCNRVPFRVHDSR